MEPQAIAVLDQALAWLGVVERELFLFAAVWLVLGALDEWAVDIGYFWLRATGRARTECASPAPDKLSGAMAVFVPTWCEEQVIATTISQIGTAWPQPELRIFVGIYANDRATLEAAMIGAGNDPRVRLVVLPHAGPTTKADCLNRLYHALQDDEARHALRYRGIVLQDAEDMVHPAAIGVFDAGLGRDAMVQLPVRPALSHRSRFVSGHYADEFAEGHAKAMVLRDALGATLPAAGVGCAISRDVLDRLAASGRSIPFAADSLTEDYELGFRIRALGFTSCFARTRDRDGRLVATMSYFPSTLAAASRQKARWMHGIAFQGWDRLGWRGNWADRWMTLRDRRGPLAALVLASAYLLLALVVILHLLNAGRADYSDVEGPLQFVTFVLIASVVWRAAMRMLFVGREYGAVEALRSLARVPVANVIGIMAGWRSLVAYWRVLHGGKLRWDKTLHYGHPAHSRPGWGAA